MLFGKNKKRQCDVCNSKVGGDHSFCPFCGNSLAETREEQEDFGLLGRSDFSEQQEEEVFPQGFGMMDKLVNNMVKSMMKSLDKQFKNLDGDLDGTEVRSFPNGVRIKISGPFGAVPKKKVERRRVVKERTVNEDQVKKMSSLPRTKAKTNVKRFGDKVVYELATPGVTTPEDVFVSKLENGYEIKAIGEKKVYVNSVPINLPLKRYSILKNKLLVEFLAGDGE